MIKRLLVMAKKHYGTLIFACCGLLGATALSLATPNFIRQLTSSLDVKDGIDMETIMTMSISLVIIYIVRAGCRFISTYFSHVAAWTFVPELTLKIYDKLQHLSMRYYQDKQTGQLMSRLINDSRQIEVLVAHAVPDFVSNLLTVVLVTIMLFTINVPLTLLTMIPVPFVFVMSIIFIKKFQPLFMVNQEVLGDLNGMLQDNLSGMKEIQAFGKEKAEYENVKKMAKLYEKVNIRANFYNGIFQPGIEFFTAMGTVVVVAAGGYLAIQGDLKTSDIIGFILYLSIFYGPVAALAGLTEGVQNAWASAVRVFDILDAESEIQDAPNAVELSGCKGKIEFSNVDFNYTQDADVLKNVSFMAQPGQMIAFVGPTGVGKTTIVSLLERFYDPISGAIKIDDTDIKDISLTSLRAQMSMVLQDVFLFHGSIADNIAYGVDAATPEQIREAAKIARADVFIEQMPEGYETLVGERGLRLSGGQKQRISIARAVLRNTPILILDEATAAIDVETEADIQQAIQSLAGSRTIVVIAHRLSTVKRADSIIVLKDGAIVEQGRHEELLKLDGEYAKLCKVQWAN